MAASRWLRMWAVLPLGVAAVSACGTSSTKSSTAPGESPEAWPATPISSFSRPGKSAADVLGEAMTEMQERGITAQIHSYPLGNRGRRFGASIDMRATRPGPDAPARCLRKGSRRR